CEKTFYGENQTSDYGWHKTSQGVIISERGVQSPPLEVPFGASHLLDNFCAAVVVARHLGLSWEEIGRQTRKLQPFKRRFEKIEREGIVYFNDSFNASPESTCAALVNLPPPQLGKRRIAVLGEMKELGAYSESGHVQVAQCALSHIDHLLCLGKGALKMVEL